MNKKNQVLTIIVCFVLCISIIIYRSVNQEKNPKSISEVFSVSNETTNPISSISNNIVNNDDSSNTNNEEPFPTQLVEDNLHVNDASDGYESEEVCIYFTNGDVLYDNEDIPVDVYVNQMTYITEYCNLNFENVSGITILEDSVELSKDTLKYKCDLNNEHYLNVTCDLSTYKFSFSDSPKID